MRIEMLVRDPKSTCWAMLFAQGRAFEDVKEGALLRLKDCKVKAGFGNMIQLEGNENSIVLKQRGFAPSTRRYETIQAINNSKAESMVSVGKQRFVDFVGQIERVTKEQNHTVAYVVDTKERDSGLIQLTRHGTESLRVTVGEHYRFRDVIIDSFDEFMGMGCASMGWQAVIIKDAGGGGGGEKRGRGVDDVISKRRKF